MLLKEKTARRRDPLSFAAYRYRIPLPVREVLQVSDGYCYPVCPRCARSFDREYSGFCDRCGQRLDWRLYDCADVVHAPHRKP